MLSNESKILVSWMMTLRFVLGRENYNGRTFSSPSVPSKILAMRIGI